MWVPQLLQYIETNNFLTQRNVKFPATLPLGTMYMGKQEIPEGKSNGLRHSIWETSENMGCDLRWCNFSSLFSLFGWFEYTL